jgi:biotin carboxyl carrier protein
MSLKGKVGKKSVEWKQLPQGREGSGVVKVDGLEYSVRWKKDSQGIWVEFDHQVIGYDFDSIENENGQTVWSMQSRKEGKIFRNLRFSRAGEETVQAGAQSKKGVRVKAQMPGRIIKVLVSEGEKVTKDQSLLIMEAMKMENEIKSTADAVVKSIKIQENQNVESGALLIELGSLT